MDRMGYDSETAPLIYLHGNDAQQQAIADTLSQRARDELQQGKGAKPGRAARKPSGTQRHGDGARLRSTGLDLRLSGR